MSGWVLSFVYIYINLHSAESIDSTNQFIIDAGYGKGVCIDFQQAIMYQCLDKASQGEASAFQTVKCSLCDLT